ncbi:hypothetical protein KUV89_13815 [Marinobacter hydrocarbonoclasticus]|nr:hypothetical protein [Marinobacter nauticus]
MKDRELICREVQDGPGWESRGHIVVVWLLLSHNDSAPGQWSLSIAAIEFVGKPGSAMTDTKKNASGEGLAFFKG